jgi:gliding motility-associated-like protein
MFFVLLSTTDYAQTVSANGRNSSGAAAGKKEGKKFQAKWKVHPFDNRLFNENKGQFPETARGWKILYGCNYDGVDIYLTDKGIIYNIAKADRKEEDLKEPDGDISGKPDSDSSSGKTKIIYQHIFIGWENASANAGVEAEGEAPSHFSEGMLEHTGKVIENIKGFQKIVYRNLYPGIDLEFSFHKEKGIKYAIKVKPGFDASVFKMKYIGDKGLSFDGSGNLHIGTIIGDIIDHAPVVTSGGNEIPSSFQKAGDNEIIFNIQHSAHNNSNELLIDPWTVFPFSPATFASDVAMDAVNNTYVLEYLYPGISPLTMYVQKYDPLGALLWTYKLNEFTTTPFNPIEIDSSSCGTWRISDMAADASGNTYIASPFGFANASHPGWQYGMVSLNTLGQRNYLDYTYSADSISEVNNVTYSCADSILIEAACRVCCNFAEFDGVNTATGNPNLGEYANNGIGDVVAGTIAPNGNYYALSASSGGSDDLLCGKVTHTSATLLWHVPTIYPFTDGESKESIGQEGSNGIAAGCAYLYTSDGLNLDQRDLSTGAIIRTVTIPGGSNASGVVNSGIAVDLSCGNVYVGGNTIIYIYDENLNSIGSFNNLPGKVADVIYRDGLITACGDSLSTEGFIVQFNALPCAPGITITHTDASCMGNTGTATATATFCSGPYNYLWTPSGQTTQTATGLSAGTYTVTVAPQSTCFSINDTVTISGAGVALTESKDSVCSGDSLTITADSTSGTTFVWAPGGATTATIHVSPIIPTTYVVHTHGGPCPNDSASVTIRIISGITASVSALNDTICPSGIATITAAGFGGTVTYKWSNGATTSSINVSPPSTATYTATVYGKCDTVTLTKTITVNPATIATISVVNDTICPTGIATITATGSGGPVTYKWNTGATTSSINVSPPSTATYTAIVYGKCDSVTLTKTITVNPATIATISPDDTICPAGHAMLTITGSGGPVAYKWNTGATSSSINVAPMLTTKYIVTTYGVCDSVKDTVTVTVIPLQIPLITGSMTKCKGVKDTLTVSGGTSYLWSDGSTKTTYYTGPIKADSTITVISYNSLGCPDTEKFPITVTPPPALAISDTNTCFNNLMNIHALASGSGTITYLWSPGGETNSTITVPDTGQSYTVTASNGCPVVKTVRLTSTAPTMNVCCNKSILLGDDTIITADGPIIKTYRWKPATGLNCDTCATVIANPTVTTTYTVTGTDSAGCSTDMTITITVETPCFNLIIPNVFTPGNAGILGLDNLFYIKTENMDAWSIIIFDRWGKEMFNTTNPFQYWNGNTESGGQAPAGVYYYIISGTCQNTSYKKDGFVQLIR